jgi:hypothetical protein
VAADAGATDASVVPPSATSDSGGSTRALDASAPHLDASGTPATPDQPSGCDCQISSLSGSRPGAARASTMPTRLHARALWMLLAALSLGVRQYWRTRLASRRAS